MSNGNGKIKPEGKIKPKRKLKPEKKYKPKGEVIKKVKAKGIMVTTTADGEVIEEVEDPEVLLVRVIKEKA